MSDALVCGEMARRGGSSGTRPGAPCARPSVRGAVRASRGSLRSRRQVGVGDAGPCACLS